MSDNHEIREIEPILERFEAEVIINQSVLVYMDSATMLLFAERLLQGQREIHVQLDTLNFHVICN